MKRAYIIFIVGLLFVQTAYAQTILYLKSGQKIEGRVVEQTNEYIRINFYGVDLVYQLDEVDHIQQDTGSSGSVLDRERAAGFVSDEQPILQESVQQQEQVDSLQEFIPVHEQAVDETSAAALEQLIGSMDEQTKAAFVQLERMQQEVAAKDNIGEGEQQQDDTVVHQIQVDTSAINTGPIPLDTSDMTPEQMQELIRSQMTPEMAQKIKVLAAGFGLFVLVFGLACYVFFSVCLQVIARKEGAENAWFAWIPILQFVLLCRIAEKPVWWVVFPVLGVIPIVNIIAGLITVVLSVFLWIEIIKKRNKPVWLVVGLFIPIVNLVVLGYIAFAN